jgi:DUF1680 family protein
MILPDGFWHERLEVNARRAIFHQWEQLEASGCIENFRIAAGESAAFRTGWFFADSDAYKWLEAAARITFSHADAELAARMEAFIALVGRAQDPDGYIFTYNQIHFPGTRWVNLQIEHELYCHGHLIEAGVSHHAATGRTDLLRIAIRAADRIAEDFCGKGPEYTPGHEEIEIALLRLYETTKKAEYLELARQFIEQRGRTPGFGLSILKQNSSVGARGKHIQKKKEEYLRTHPGYKFHPLPAGNAAKKPWNSTLRWFASALSGKYFQQHAPIREQNVPTGHAVRFAYLETATARLARVTGDGSLVPALERAWEQMTARRMYITGGIGSLPGLEGFGNDYELDPETAYAETCAALACMSWNWEMAQLTGEAKYSDLFEWQLYNAASVGMGLDGTSYFYNNPLTCRGGVRRKPWYAVPCCPSNLSRTWADLGKYILSREAGTIWIHQYISSRNQTEMGEVNIHSELPWNGKVEVRVSSPGKFTLFLRLPAWSGKTQVQINQQDVHWEAGTSKAGSEISSDTLFGASRFLPITRSWSANDVVEIYFDDGIRLLHAHPNVRGHAGKAAIARGPLVYCLESSDNPGTDIFNERLDDSTLRAAFDQSLLGGVVTITDTSMTGKNLTFIPYHLWGNRGPSRMTTWVKI